MNLQLIVCYLVLQFVASSSQETVHSCTLDDDLCGGTLTSKIKVDKSVLSATDAAYRITDVTSITTPTSNSEVCQIPYSFAGKEHFHCRGTVPNVNCATLNGQSGNCMMGQFFYEKLSTLNTERYTSAKIPIPKSVNSADSVNFRFSFYYLFECSGSSCATLADSLIVSVNGHVLGELTYGNAIFERRWIQHSFDFTSSDSEIQYEIALNRPRPPTGTKSMMAFDQFELITLSDGNASSSSRPTTKKTSTTVQPSSITTISSSKTTIGTTQATDSAASSTSTVPSLTTTATNKPTTTKRVQTSTVPETTISPTTTTTTTSRQPSNTNAETTTGSQLVYFPLITCDFDQDLCGGIVKGLNQRENELSPINLTYRITDVTSITKPTSNGQRCQIPYSIGGQEYFHCSSRPSYKCITTTGSDEACTLGKFLSIRSTTGAAIEGSYTSVKKSIPTSFRQDAPTSFRLSFYYLFDCPSDDCDKLDDSITLTFNQGQMIGTLNNSVTKSKRAWNPHWFDFTTSDSEIQITATLKRSAASRIRYMIAIDNLELMFLADPSFTTLKPIDEASTITTTTSKVTSAILSSTTRTSTTKQVVTTIPSVPGSNIKLSVNMSVILQAVVNVSVQK